ncbi:hypothetical protein [Streptomyces sp. NPDC059008]|uniref:hypothetical protein n=1 Tax=Streptomyces sp. NPDC059008 TaxID=3346693 RepID=UPI0036A58B05
MDIVHGLYYVVMHAVFAVFGDSLLTLRLPSVLATALACGLTALIGARLSDRWVGIGAGCGLVVIPAVQEHAQEGRPYGLVLAFVALATWLLVGALERPTPGRWACYAGSVLIAALLNWFSLLALVAHGVTMAYVRPGRARVLGWALASCSALAAALPLVLASQEQAGQVSWIKPLGWSTVLGVLVTAAIAALGARTPQARTAHGGREGTPSARVHLAAVALPLCALPQFGLALASVIKPLYVTRYVLFAYVGLALLLGALLAAIAVRLTAQPRVLFPAVVAVTLLALLPMELRLRTEDSRVDDVLTAAHLVDRIRHAGDGVVYIPAARRDTALVSPDAFQGLRDLALAQGPQESGTLKGIEAAPRTIERAMLDTPRIVLVTDPGAPAPDTARDLTKQRVLERHFVRRSTRTERGRQVSVYERRRPAGSDGSCGSAPGSACTAGFGGRSWRYPAGITGRLSALAGS